MNRIIPVVLCALLGIVLTGETIPDQVNGQPEISTEKLVGAMRTLNTAEVSYYVNGNRRYADRDQLLAYLRQQGYLGNESSPVDSQPSELRITTSWDGQHYQISLLASLDEKYKSAWCKPAVFSDDKGAIFLGQGLGCEETPQKP